MLEHFRMTVCKKVSQNCTFEATAFYVGQSFMDASIRVPKHMFPTGNQAYKTPLEASEKWHNSNGQSS